MMVDRLKYGTPAWNQRQRIHAHNGCFGGVRYAEMWMLNIRGRDSVSPRGQQLAGEILTRLYELREELKHRVDPPQTAG